MPIIFFLSIHPPEDILVFLNLKKFKQFFIFTLSIAFFTYVLIHLIMHACVPSCFSRVRFFATPWTVAYDAPPSMGFSRHEYWSGLPKKQIIVI